MSDVNIIQTRSKLALLRKSTRLFTEHLEAELKPIEATEENERVSEEHQSEEISSMELDSSTAESCEIHMDSEEHEKKIEECPITTPRRKVGPARSFNITACIEASERAQQQAKLMGLCEVVVHELICLGAHEKQYLTVDDVVKCYDRHELVTQ